MRQERTAAEDRRRTILAAAAKVFDAHGYAATTVESVAEEAGIAKGSIYNYFQSKEDLFNQVFNSVVSVEFSDFWKVVKEDCPAIDKLNAVLDLWYERLEQHGRIGRLVLEFWATAARDEQHKGEFATTFSEVYTNSRNLIASILAQGAADGEFGRQFDTPLEASLIVAILDGIQIESILQMGPKVDAELLAGLKRGILAALGGSVAAD